MNVCQRCVALHSKVVCSGCWLLHWRKRCFQCAHANSHGYDYGIDCGKFCKACAQLRSAEGRDETLRGEAAAHELSQSRDETPTGAESALQGLLN